MPVAYTFRILAIGGIAFNLALAAWPRETTNILFKHLTNTRCPGRARSAVCLGPKQLCRFGKQRRNRDAATGEKEGKRRSRGCLFCYYPCAQVRWAAYLGAFASPRLASSRPLLQLSAGLALFPTPFFHRCFHRRFSSLYALCVVHSSSRLPPCSVSDVVIARSPPCLTRERRSTTVYRSPVCYISPWSRVGFYLFATSGARFLLFAERRAPCLPIGLRPCVHRFGYSLLFISVVSSR